MDKIKFLEDIKHTIPTFKHCIKGTVKFTEVDSFRVVHNIQYLYWLEWAKIEYFRSIGIKLNNKSFTEEFLMMVVHSEIDYYNSLQFDDKYKIYTKITELKNTSIKFSNIVINELNDILVVSKSVFVHLNNITKLPERIPDYIRDLINNYEI